MEIELEIWKDIPDYEGIYEASNLGRVRTCEGKTTYTKKHGARQWKQRILIPKICQSTKNKNRYDARLELWKNGKHKSHLVSRLVISAFYGKSNLTVNHINGNSLDNRILNLEYVSLADNIRKGFETGLYSTQKAIRLTDKKTGLGCNFRSLTQASKYMNKSHSYLHDKIQIGKFENATFRWELL